MLLIFLSFPHCERSWQRWIFLWCLFYWETLHASNISTKKYHPHWHLHFHSSPLEMNATIPATCHSMSSLYYQKQTYFLKGFDYNYLFIISLESGRKQQLSHHCLLQLWNKLVGWDETSIIQLARGHRATKVIKQESSMITDLTLIPERL